MAHHAVVSLQFASMIIWLGLYGGRKQSDSDRLGWHEETEREEALSHHQK